jgi:aspartate carbamoyltransferase catalytic subunit
MREQWHHHHILDLDDFSQEEIELVFQTTEAMKGVLKREIKRVPTLRGKTIFLLFYEPSTRTRVSFELAAKNLGADVVNISTTQSSVVKGESLVDTINTLQSLGADLIVMRHFRSGAPYLATQHFLPEKSLDFSGNPNLAIKLINAGDGCHAHPTQALLDLYTIQERLGQFAGLKVAIIGDIKHSRVARSDIWGLSLMGAQTVLCGPPTLIPQGIENFPSVAVETDIDRALEEADVVMPLRLQEERQEDKFLPGLREYIQLYQVNEVRLGKAKPNVLLMHPGPMNEGIEIAPEVAYGKHSVIGTQVNNGVAVRMTLFYLLLASAAHQLLV